MVTFTTQWLDGLFVHREDGGSTPLEPLRPWLVPLLGGLVFVGVFAWRYASIPDPYYVDRDDGVITLSHARNWVEYGFIGVNPSGERVEGFSSPLQLVIYAALYACFGLGYHAYAALQTLLCTFAIGAWVAHMFEGSARLRLGATALAAALCAGRTDFMEWHGSGMESALTHACTAWALCAIYRAARRERFDFSLCVPLFLLSLTRLEGIYHVGPWLVLIAVYGAWQLRQSRALAVCILTLLLWCVAQAQRVAYFGDWLPNTAYAQNISVSMRLKALWQLVPEYLGDSARLAGLILLRHGSWLWLASLPLLPFVRRSRPLGLLTACLVASAATCAFHPFLFGEGRLDPVRTTSQLALVSALWPSVLLTQLRPLPSRAFGTRAVAALGAALLLGTGWLTRTEPAPKCCGVLGMEELRGELRAAADREQIARPTIANADLGVMSWHKQFNVIDFGALGTPVVAKIGNTPGLGHYLFEYAAPDLIETHEYWSCLYARAFFFDPRFQQRYVPLRMRIAHSVHCPGLDLPEGLFVRAAIRAGADTAERHLLDRLARGPSAAVILAALERCSKRAPTECAYVVRCAYRILPELRGRGEQRAVLAAFRGHPLQAFAIALLTGADDGQAHMALFP